MKQAIKVVFVLIVLFFCGCLAGCGQAEENGDAVAMLAEAQKQTAR
ncbi:MAG: hypothetical protein SWK76_12620 [Actinomycetota bacterium]|nr:hypothetical protein [Actinomycetota bacterium]